MHGSVGVCSLMHKAHGHCDCCEVMHVPLLVCVFLCTRRMVTVIAARRCMCVLSVFFCFVEGICSRCCCEAMDACACSACACE